MSRRNEIYDQMPEVEDASKCAKFARLVWKFIRCVFSHITLVSAVVAYCVIGAYAFESLEADHEKEVKRSIKDIRRNITENLWMITTNEKVLIRENWTEKALLQLEKFENSLIVMMNKEGWDGSEEENDIQWTFLGALFYSIIVITTIGYGHIAPKTKNGKVMTIFYAILGIPLMLLCLSNIGDIMASSFRFLYWKICCYVCTKPPKKRRSRSQLSRSLSVRQPGRYGSNRGASFRRSVRLSQRSADSALGLSEGMARSSYSDTDCRFNSRRFDENDPRRGASVFSQVSSPPAFRSATVPRFLDQSVATPKPMRGNSRLTTQSLDRRLMVSPTDVDRTPVLCNKYALNELENEMLKWQSTTSEKGDSPKSQNTANTESETEKQRSYSTRSLPRRCLSVEGATSNHTTNLVPPSIYLEMEQPRRSRLPSKSRRSRTNLPVARSYKHEAPSPRIMSPMGFAVQRQIYANEVEFDYDYYVTSDGQECQPIKPVPIWLCVFLVVSYIFGGAFLFSGWENWPFLDSAYFCFITLTTIGFGDLVPAHKLNAHKGIALCSLYLLFGIALLAMSFNLVQEEVINNVKSVAKRLGILKESDDEEDYDDYDDYDIAYDDYDFER
ncbi:uncharacterized protein galene [Prorops nasuta]|uniref:uncharacterized protein galene n=1 Tax=Prorops nasuta TaxID=863751 RepID=UPI0034CE48EE